MSFTRYLLVFSLSITVFLSGCSLFQTPDTTVTAGDFELPDSVMVDLGEETTEPSSSDSAATEAASTPKQQQVQTSTTTQSEIEKETVDPAVIAPPAPKTLAARNPEHQKQADLAKSDFKKGVDILKKGDLDTAYKIFADLSQQYPALAGPIINQAIILRKQNKSQAAYDLLQSAVITHSGNPQLLNELGVSSRALGKFKPAQVSYESAIRIDKNYAKAHYNLAVLADLYLHNPQLALQEFKIYQSLQSKPSKTINGWITELERRAARTQK